MASVETNIAEAMVQGLRKKLNLDTNTAFISAKPVYDLGWEGDLVYQVHPGNSQVYGDAEGAQVGGGFKRKKVFGITMFSRLNLDIHGRSEEIIAAHGQGLLDKCEQVLNIFKHTYLGTILQEKMWWEGTGEPAWEDEENGWMSVEIDFGCVYMDNVPTYLTLTQADLI